MIKVNYEIIERDNRVWDKSKLRWIHKEYRVIETIRRTKKEVTILRTGIFLFCFLVAIGITRIAFTGKLFSIIGLASIILCGVGSLAVAATSYRPVERICIEAFTNRKVAERYLKGLEAKQ